MENKVKNISRFDYILWDKSNNKPLERLDIVYHYTSIIELINDGFKLNESEEFVCVAELPIAWQEKINIAIEENK